MVLSGSLPTSTAESGLPWELSTTWPGAAIEGGMLHRPGRSPLPFSGAVASGQPTAGAHVMAVRDDARPLVVHRSSGEGCIVYSAVSLDDDGLTGSAGYVDFIDDLSGACAEGLVELDLDAGAVTALTRPDLPARVALADLGAGAGTPLSPLLLALALALLGTELVLTRRRP